MKYPLLLWFFLVTCLINHCLAQSNDSPYEKAQQAWNQKNYPTYLHNIQQIVDQVGNHPGLLLGMARAYALDGDSTAAIRIIRQLAEMQLPFLLTRDTAFVSLQNNPEFRQLAGRFYRYAQPTLRSQAGFVIRNRTFFPEGIAYDPSSRTFYVGSLTERKILQVNQKGNAKNFTESGQDGLWAVLGMKVESPKRMLWVCSADLQNGHSALFQYNLKTGQLVKKCSLDNRDGKHLLNDLTILPTGEIYLTDSEAGTVYFHSPEQEELVPLNPAIQLIYPNGITHSWDHKLVYVAHFGGITTIDLLTREARPLKSPQNVPLFGMDGLYFYENTLIGIQNGIEADRIMQYQLSSDGREVVSSQVLESNHPSFRIPTTGTIVGKSFYYIANSQLRNILPDGLVYRPESLKDILVLQIKLD